MAVRATYLALRDLCLQSYQANTLSAKRCNVLDLVAIDVVKFQDPDVRLATVHARVTVQIFTHDPGVAYAILFHIAVSPSIVNRRVQAIIVLGVLSHT
jgi:hypothetical protein